MGGGDWVGGWIRGASLTPRSRYALSVPPWSLRFSITKYSRLVVYKQQKFISHILEAGSPRSGPPHIQCQVRIYFLAVFSPRPHDGKGRGLPGSLLSYKDTGPFGRRFPHNQITSKDPTLLSPSLWGQDFNMDFGGYTDIQAMATPTAKPMEGSAVCK